MNTNQILFFCLSFLIFEVLAFGSMYINITSLNDLFSSISSDFASLKMPSGSGGLLGALDIIADTIKLLIQMIVFVIKSSIVLSIFIFNMVVATFQIMSDYPYLIPLNALIYFGIIYALVSKIRIAGSGFGGDE